MLTDKESDILVLSKQIFALTSHFSPNKGIQHNLWNSAI